MKKAKGKMERGERVNEDNEVDEDNGVNRVIGAVARPSGRETLSMDHWPLS